MNSRRAWTVLIAAATLICAAAPNYRVTRPDCRCGIPPRDYEFGVWSQPILVTSLGAAPILPANSTTPLVVGAANSSGMTAAGSSTAEVLPAPTAVPQPVAILRPSAGNAFQFKESSLASEQCTISRMAVQLFEDGTWIITLRADQNPVVSTAAPIAATLTTNPASTPQSSPALTANGAPTLWTDHILRNQFKVVVRCYSVPSSAVQGAGQPVVAILAPSPFWVQRAKPVDYKAQGADPAIARFYTTIDHVDLQFSFRKTDYQLP